MTLPEALYRESLLRWLQARRDQPTDNTPEPEKPMPWVELLGNGSHRWVNWTAIRAEVIRDWERTEKEADTNP